MSFQPLPRQIPGMLCRQLSLHTANAELILLAPSLKVLPSSHQACAARGAVFSVVEARELAGSCTPAPSPRPTVSEFYRLHFLCVLCRGRGPDPFPFFLVTAIALTGFSAFGLPQPCVETRPPQSSKRSFTGSKRPCGSPANISAIVPSAFEDPPPPGPTPAELGARLQASAPSQPEHEALLCCFQQQGRG